MRELKVKIARGNKNFSEFSVQEKPRMSVLLLLDEILETQDSSIYYESVCRSSICGSCAVKINGQPKLACKTQTSSLPENITLEPLDFFPLIKDLATDKSRFFLELNRKLETWIHPSKPFSGKDEIMPEEVSAKLYERERCIECGICVSACPAASFTNFMSASGTQKALRFLDDPRNSKEAQEKLIAVLASDEGLWGCHGVGACENFCPKEIPLTRQLAESRREIIKLILRDWFKK
ncbi:MAG: 4Fe-4S dicluster domain-containing protein [Candidatus Nealsonbacteria bacterium]|nr:4Fe-4S dicluster domain-containing protein [Candidatus Nealsonbacteria bacterium]